MKKKDFDFDDVIEIVDGVDEEGADIKKVLYIKYKKGGYDLLDENGKKVGEKSMEEK